MGSKQGWWRLVHMGAVWCSHYSPCDEAICQGRDTFTVKVKPPRTLTPKGGQSRARSAKFCALVRNVYADLL